VKSMKRSYIVTLGKKFQFAIPMAMVRRHKLSKGDKAVFSVKPGDTDWIHVRFLRKPTTVVPGKEAGLP
jgi:hypothetical protein